MAAAPVSNRPYTLHGLSAILLPAGNRFVGSYGGCITAIAANFVR